MVRSKVQNFRIWATKGIYEKSGRIKQLQKLVKRCDIIERVPIVTPPVTPLYHLVLLHYIYFGTFFIFYVVYIYLGGIIGNISQLHIRI